MWEMFLFSTEVEELDWTSLTGRMELQYDDKVSISHTGMGSVETLSSMIDLQRVGVWRRECWCESPLEHVSSDVGKWSVWEGPPWLFGDLVCTWTAVLMFFVYFEWVTDGKERRRRKRETERQEQQRRHLEQEQHG
jgi:hypothetical protein